jgi:hypothetical protein
MSVAIVKQFRGSIGRYISIVKEELITMGADTSNASNDKKVATTAISKDKYMDVAFLGSANKIRYGKLLGDLENYHTKGSDNYPKSVTSAYNLIVNYNNCQRPIAQVFNGSKAVYFTNTEKNHVDRKTVH